jgi:hypothetical protein
MVAMDADIQFEIDCRKLLLKKLEPTMKRLRAADATEKASREVRKTQILGSYESVEEAHDAFGYGYITEAEYKAIANGVEAPAVKSVESVAFEILNDFVTGLKQEIKDFKWEALPQAERDRIRESNEQYVAELHTRRSAL